jgi:cytochrome c2
VKIEPTSVIWQRIFWLVAGGILGCFLFLLAFIFRDEILASFPQGALARLKSTSDSARDRPAELQTALLRLKIETLPIDIESGKNCRSAGSIAEESSSRLLHVTCDGRLFWFSLKAGIPPEPIDLDLNLGEVQMLNFVAGRGRYDQRIVAVHDVLKLRSGDYALTLSRWDDAEKCVRFELGTVSLEARSPVFATLFRSEPCLGLNLEGSLLGGHQAGGRLAEPSDGVLLFTVGDFTRDGVVSEPSFPQDPSVPYGKLIELRVADGSHRVVAAGLRNPQGLVVTRDGRIFETEHGPQGGDELNLLREGGNYGWPNVTYGTDYDLDYWPLSTHTGRHDGYLKPSYAWVPSVGVGQLIEISGFAPEWDGDLLVGALATYSLWRLRIEDEHVVYAEEIPIDERIRDIIRLADGRIAILSDAGRIVLIDAAPKSERPQPAPEVIAQRCLECHTLSLTPGAGGRISLAGLPGRQGASWPGASYSPALSAVGGTWTRDRLRDYLKDPQTFAPGTNMIAGISETKVLEDILDGLEALDTPKD